MIFGQLIEYNLINIFFKNHALNFVEKIFSEPFLKTSKESIYLDQQSEVLYNLFLLYFKVDNY